MAPKNSQYYALMREYEQTRLKNHDLQMKRYEEFTKNLEFKSLDESVSIPFSAVWQKNAKRRSESIVFSQRRACNPAAEQKEPSYFCRISQRLSGTDLRLSRLHGHRIYRKRKMSLFQTLRY